MTPPHRPPQHSTVTSLPLSQELVHAAIGKAEGARELLEKVTAEGAGGVSSGSGCAIGEALRWEVFGRATACWVWLCTAHLCTALRGHTSAGSAVRPAHMPTPAHSACSPIRS